jgi:hypothetical protein
VIITTFSGHYVSLEGAITKKISSVFRDVKTVSHITEIKGNDKEIFNGLNKK